MQGILNGWKLNRKMQAVSAKAQKIFLNKFSVELGYHQSRRHGWALVGLAPSNKAPSLPN